jgi:hypothetical protein
MDASSARTYSSIRDASAREPATYSKIVLARDVFPVIRLLTFPPPGGTESRTLSSLQLIRAFF